MPGEKTHNRVKKLTKLIINKHQDRLLHSRREETGLRDREKTQLIVSWSHYLLFAGNTVLDYSGCSSDTVCGGPERGEKKQFWIPARNFTIPTL